MLAFIIPVLHKECCSQKEKNSIVKFASILFYVFSISALEIGDTMPCGPLHRMFSPM